MLEMIFGSEDSGVNILILIVGIGVLLGLIYSYLEYKKLVDRYNIQKTKIKDKTVEVTGEGSANIISSYEGISSEFMEEIEDGYEKIGIKYNVCIQLISLFPMFGILGTVMGLMKQIAAAGIEQLTSSVALALGSTIVAIFCAVALRIVDIFTAGKEASIIEGYIAKYDKSFNTRTTIEQLENSKTKKGK